MIQFKGVYFMWFKVTIFHAEQHTLLIQSLQQGIFCVFTSLAAVVLVLCGQNLVSCSQPLFPVDCRKRGLLHETSQTSLSHRALLFSVQAESDNTLCEEWSGHARLQFFMVSSFSKSLTQFSNFSIGCNNGRWWQSQRQRSSWAAKLVFYCKVLVQHIKLSHVWNSQYDCINQLLVPAKILRK